jgi:cell division transport system permease protein
MVTNLYRILKYGFQIFGRNSLASIATVSIMVFSAALFLALILLGTVGKVAVETLKDKIDINVSFSENAPEDDILKLKESLSTLVEVKSVDYTSKDEALELFKKRHEADPVIIQALSEIDKNPLSASISIKAKDPSEYSAIAAYLNSGSFENIIDKVSYNQAQNQMLIDRLATLIKKVKIGWMLLTILLTVMTVIVSFITILLVIYNTKDEINIMRLVGASNAFIRGPYIFVGILYGLISAVIAFIVVSFLVWLAAPQLLLFVPGMNLWAYLLSRFFGLFGLTALFGVAIGSISSSIVIRRYLVG